MQTKEVLEDALAQFGGTIILVSHDRYLLNKVADRIIEVRSDEVNSYEGNFDAYYQAVTAQQQELAQQQQERKLAEQAEEYAQNKQRQHRSKQQRAEDAKRRERIRQLENEIEDTEQLIEKLEAQIADPQTASDYSVINEKCSQLDEARNRLEDMMDQWAELSEKI